MPLIDPTDEMVARVTEYVREGGATAERAAARAGVTHNTFKRWKRQGRKDIAEGAEGTACARLCIALDWAIATSLAPAEKLLRDRINASLTELEEGPRKVELMVDGVPVEREVPMDPRLHALGDKAAMWRLERLDPMSYGARTITEIVERRTAQKLLEAAMPHMSESARRELLAALEIVGVAMDEEGES